MMQTRLKTLLLTCFASNAWCNGVYNVSNWKYHFPSGSGMGIYAALALPVPDSGYIDLFYAVFFEAFYSLPFNETSFEYPPLVSSRLFGRKPLYESIETKLSLKGFSGRNCLLKAICEASAYTTLHANGLIGDLIHLFFTPSSTRDHVDNAFGDYIEAEESGWKTQNCQKYSGCSLNLFDLMTFIR